MSLRRCAGGASVERSPVFLRAGCPLWVLVPRSLTAVVLLALTVGCRQDMHDAPRIDPLESNAFFENDMGARPLTAGTVARGWLREDTRMYQGKDEAGAFVDALPVPLDAALLTRGQQRFEIFCSVCHDSTGGGRGMIVRRGFQEPPPFTDPRVVGMPIGYYFDVMTNGFGVMSGYAAQVPVADRWAIAAYIRVLQVSQRSELATLPVARQAAFRDALANPVEDPAEDDGHQTGEHGAPPGHSDDGHSDDDDHAAEPTELTHDDSHGS